MKRSHLPVLSATAFGLLAPALPAQLSWRKAAAAPSPRSGHYAFFDEPRGRVTVVSGQTDLQPATGDCWQLDAVGAGEWFEQPVTAGQRRANGACCEDVTPGSALLFGGEGGCLRVTDALNVRL